LGNLDLAYLGNRAVGEWQGCDPNVRAVIEDRMKNGYKALGGEVNPLEWFCFTPALSLADG
jgi:hypothetical protein